MSNWKIQTAPAMQAPCIEFPGIDSGWIEREDAMRSEIPSTAQAGAVIPVAMGAAAAAVSYVEDRAEVPGHRRKMPLASSLAGLPPPPGSWDNRGCDIEPQELENDIPYGLYTETNASPHTGEKSSPEEEELNTQEDYGVYANVGCMSIWV
ncbi:uncharacterized protein [Lolium perenne]|uniref:uncharacterized protein isoform X4 n=1 Tax=Lolium perenne TaxID=4522 RepID=UPI0021F651E3|nr:uncharacterized protein LOC127307377 isoform X3 [Lolium perenne]